jgi:hypothetical protein
MLPGTVVHRIGGRAIANLRLKPRERALTPPGISVLIGGTPQEAADQMRQAFPRAQGLHQAARTVGSAVVDAIRQAGFDVIAVPTGNLPNHGRIIHPLGAAGFIDEALEELSRALQETTGC